MTAQVIQLDDHRPQVTITTHANKVHVIPLSFWIDIAKGKQSIDSLGDNRDAIVRVLLSEWLVRLAGIDPEELLEIAAPGEET